MKRKVGRIAVMILVLSASAVCPGWAEETTVKAGPNEKKAAVKSDTDKGVAQGQGQPDETKKLQEWVKKQIADSENEAQGIQARKDAGRDLDMLLYRDKRLDLLESQLDLLRQAQTALETNDLKRARELRDQAQAMMTDWWNYGEREARIDAQREEWEIRVGNVNDPNVKAAWGELMRANEAVLKKAAEKKVLDGELRDLDARQKESAEKLERLYRDAQRQEKKKEARKDPNG